MSEAQTEFAQKNSTLSAETSEITSNGNVVSQIQSENLSNVTIELKYYRVEDIYYKCSFCDVHCIDRYDIHRHMSVIHMEEYKPKRDSVIIWRHMESLDYMMVYECSRDSVSGDHMKAYQPNGDSMSKNHMEPYRSNGESVSADHMKTYQPNENAVSENDMATCKPNEDSLICKKCGKKFALLNSHFCNKSAEDMQKIIIKTGACFFCHDSLADRNNFIHHIRVMHPAKKFINANEVQAINKAIALRPKLF